MKKKKKKPPPPPKPVEKIVTCGDSFKTIKDSADLPPGKVFNQEWHYENCVRFPFDGEQLRLAGKDAGKPPKPKFVKQVATGQFWAHNKQKYLVVNGIDDPLDQAERHYVCPWTNLNDRNNAFRPVCQGCVRNDFRELPEPNVPAPK
ncbi:hypothetical protein PtB15_11B358 [Puccinia triticina]|nr:hypothetical protein PtB15_11B358 [Puccinia triticina]